MPDRNSRCDDACLAGDADIEHSAKHDGGGARGGHFAACQPVRKHGSQSRDKQEREQSQHDVRLLQSAHRPSLLRQPCLSQAGLHFARRLCGAGGTCRIRGLFARNELLGLFIKSLHIRHGPAVFAP